jgi:hypothetical protein
MVSYILFMMTSREIAGRILAGVEVEARATKVMRAARERATALHRVVALEVVAGLYVTVDKFDGPWRYTISDGAKVLAERVTAGRAVRACVAYAMRP